MKAIQCVAKGATYITPLLAGDLISNLLTMGPQEISRDATLTVRQREVLQLLAEGHTMKEIARLLKITPRTVAFHKYAMMEQLGVTSNAELVKAAIKHHLVTS